MGRQRRCSTPAGWSATSPCRSQVGWGYRGASLLELARGDDLERLLGHRPRPLVLDGWLPGRCRTPASTSHWGHAAGTGVWLAVTARRW